MLKPRQQPCLTDVLYPFLRPLQDFSSKVTAVLLLISFLTLSRTTAQQSGSVCDTTALPAFFEIDANLRSGTVNTASDDWFTGSSGTGIGVIGTTSATAYPALPLSVTDFRNLLQTAATPVQRNVTYAQRMVGSLAAVRTTALGSVMLLEAVAGRDHFSSVSTVDSSSFTVGRNADNPLHNWAVGSAVHTTDAEIIDAGVHYRRIKTGATTFGDCWGFGFVTNANGAGDGFYDFEFFQTGPVFNTSSGAVTMTGPDSTGGHTPFYFTADSGKIVQTGDVVLSLDQENGGLSQQISVRIWVNPSLLGPGITTFSQFNAKAGRQFEFTGLFDTGLNGNGYGYAEIRPRGTPTNCVFYASLNRSGSCRIPAGPWGTIEAGTGNYKDSLECYQYTECGINFSRFGLENVLLRLNCNYPSVSVVVKSRASAQFTANIKDYAGPYLMRNIVESNAGPDKQLVCVSSPVTLNGSTATPTPTITWSVVPGSGGNIVSGANTLSPVVNATGKYVLSVGNILIAPCTATDTVEVISAPVVVTGFSPAAGGPGTSVTVSGSGFTGATGVQFNGVSATTFSVLSDTQLTASVPAAATTGVITVQKGLCSAVSSASFVVSVSLDLKFFLQGYYLGGGQMSRPMYTLGLTGDSTVSDSATVQLFASSNLVTPAFVYKGVFRTDGSMSCTFSGSSSGNSYYVVIISKSHLQTWSKNPVLFSNTTSYDFTTAASQGYADQMAGLGGGVFGFYAGDITNGTTAGVQDGYIDGADFSLMENLIPLGLSGTYESGDLDGDGYVNGFDYSLLQNNIPLGLTIARPF
ncbi:MAG: hypothetical protein RL213_824 [Bacteroidota bacterium]|jgi:hypothetical protein